MQLSDYATLPEAAKLAKVSKRTIQHHMEQGTAPKWERKGREVLFLKADVVKWREKHYPEGQSRPGKKLQSGNE